MVGAGEGFVENPEMAAQGRCAIDVNRGADAVDDILDRHFLGKKLIVSIGEVMHWTLVVSLLDWMVLAKLAQRPQAAKVAQPQVIRVRGCDRSFRQSRGGHRGNGTGVGRTKFSGFGGGFGTVLVIS